MLDQLRQQIQTHLDELLGEADKLRHALAAPGTTDAGRWAPSAKTNEDGRSPIRLSQGESIGWPFAMFGSGG